MKAVDKNYSEILKENERSQKSQEYFRQNIVFKSNAVKQDLIDFASYQGWQLKAIREADIKNYLPLEIAWVTSEQTAIHYIEDWHIEDAAVYPFSLKTPYLIIEGKNPQVIALFISSKFDTYSDQEIITSCQNASNSDDLIDAVVRLSYAAPEKFDYRYFSTLKKVLCNSDTWVRLATVWAIGCISWCELYDLLKDQSETDPSEDVQLQASQLLQIYNIEGENRLLTVLD
jgi:hypothetical protein